MNKKKLGKTGKVIVSACILISILVSLLVPAFAAQRISGSQELGGVDGIDSNPDVGIHNSYAWCAEILEQEDGDYLWLGTNRDIGAAITYFLGPVGASIGLDVNETLGIPNSDMTDRKGKIYRQKIGDTDAQWEFVYDMPGITGWRRMITYNGDLYVLAANSVLSINYTVVLRFKADFDPKTDEPEVVLWDNFPNPGDNEYFRAACVYNGLLYIGTFDGKIYVTDGTELKNLTPKLDGSGEKHTGWELAIDFEGHPDFEAAAENSKNTIWDIIGYNGFIYASVTNSGTGFTLYKLTPDENTGVITGIRQVVGGMDCSKYPAGLGVGKPGSLSPFVVTVDGKEYVYATTLHGGPRFLIGLGLGEAESIMENMHCPAQMYRFDENDNWEVVVGEKSGDLLAVDKAGNAIPHVGNQRGGFFAGMEGTKNVSPNLYIWWMANHNGKVYASTWDTAVFKDYAALMVGVAFLGGFGFEDAAGAYADILPIIEKLTAAVGTLMDSAAGAESLDPELLSAAVDKAVASVGSILSKGTGLATTSKITLELTRLFSGFTGGKKIGAIIDIAKALVELYKTAEGYGTNISAGIEKALSTAFALSSYALDKSNPAGFDLFVSEDGVNFEPVTVDGFGDKYNYGGRVLVGTDYGLFQMTANPFNGAQVWRVDELENSLVLNAPKSVLLSNEKNARFSLQSIGLNPSADISVKLENEEGLALARVVRRDSDSKAIVDYRSDIKLSRSLTTYGGYKYTENRTAVEFEANMFDIVLIPLKAGSADNVKLTITMDGKSVSKTFDLSVTGEYDALGTEESDPTDTTETVSSDEITESPVFSVLTKIVSIIKSLFGIFK